MHKVKVFCILFFLLSIFAFHSGCAKKIDTVKSSEGIEDSKAVGASAKQDKPAKVPGGNADKDVERKTIGEEGVGKGTTSIETSGDIKASEPGETAKGGDLPSMETAGSLSEKDGGEILSPDKENHIVQKEPGPLFEGGGRHDSRQEGTLPEALKKDEERMVTPDKEILVAKDEPGPILESIRKGREDSGLKDIFFEFNSWIIKGDLMGILEQDGKYLISNPGLKVQIEGHADERGTNEYNLALGERRAKSTMNFLVDMGVGPERISIISYGEERPFCKDQGESCWATNRRGHFLVID